MAISVGYTDRKGAGCVRSFSDVGPELDAYLDKLRRDAIIRRDGVRIGELRKSDGRWRWYYDPSPNANEEDDWERAEDMARACPYDPAEFDR